MAKIFFYKGSYFVEEKNTCITTYWKSYTFYITIVFWQRRKNTKIKKCKNTKIEKQRNREIEKQKNRKMEKQRNWKI